MYRLLLRYKRLLFLTFVFLVLLYPVSFLLGSNPSVPCDVGDKTRKYLVSLAKDTDKILNKYKILHFLCYDTLWGALRNGRLAPWANKFSMCIMNEDLQNLDEVYLERGFKKAGMQLKYDARIGVYKVVGLKNPDLAFVELVVFEKMSSANPQALDQTKARRIGWKHRILPPDSQSLDSFPERLIMPPLPKIKIANIEVPTPRENIEIQKYHYQDTWWKEMRPLGC